jgi:hypothetical protein
MFWITAGCIWNQEELTGEREVVEQKKGEGIFPRELRLVLVHHCNPAAAAAAVSRRGGRSREGK